MLFATTKLIPGRGHLLYMEIQRVIDRLGGDWVAVDAVSVGFLLLFWVLLAEATAWADVPSLAFVAAATISLSGYLLGRLLQRG